MTDVKRNRKFVLITDLNKYITAYNKTMKTWKNIVSGILLAVFTLSYIPYANANELPNLPELPVFETIIPPDSMDVFSPATTPTQVAPTKTTTPSTQKPSTTTNKTTSTMTPVKNTNKQITSQNNYKTPTKTTTQKSYNTNNSYYKNNAKNSTYVVPKGKKFKVRIQQTISDKTIEGTRISFVSTYPETSTYITVPAGTVFKGRVSNTHEPYLSGNGGLIVINVDQMIYRGKTYDINAKVSIANGKRIYLNNIKGKRMYFQSFPKALKPGTSFFKKMWKVTCKLAQNDSGVEIILTPFSLLTGSVVYAVNFVASPVLALFYKGKSITIPADSPFTIQLRENVNLLK